MRSVLVPLAHRHTGAIHTCLDLAAGALTVVFVIGVLVFVQWARDDLGVRSFRRLGMVAGGAAVLALCCALGAGAVYLDDQSNGPLDADQISVREAAPYFGLHATDAQWSDYRSTYADSHGALYTHCTLTRGTERSDYRVPVSLHCAREGKPVDVVPAR